MKGSHRNRQGPARHRRPSRARGAAVVEGLLACSAVVWQSSHATFSANTVNSGNTLGAGTVTIVNDSASAIMFAAPALAPGATGTTCVGVQYTGSLAPTAIRLYLGGAQESNAGGAYSAWANDATSEADDNLTLQIQINNTDLLADPGYNQCAPAGVGTFTDVAAAAPGTNLRTLINTNSSFATGLAAQWGTITANRWRVFRFTYTFAAAAPNGAQGDGVRFNIVWEAQR